MDPLATLELSGSEEGSEEEAGKKEVKLDYQALLSKGYEEPEKLEAEKGSEVESPKKVTMGSLREKLRLENGGVPRLIPSSQVEGARLASF